MHTEDRGCGRLGREAWGLVCQCRKDETQGIGQWEGWQGHVWQKQLGENESHLSQASYSCAHRCAPPQKKHINLTVSAQRTPVGEARAGSGGPWGGWWLVAGCTICQMVLSWRLGPLLGRPPLIPGAGLQWLAEAWPLGGRGQRRLAGPRRGSPGWERHQPGRVPARPDSPHPSRAGRTPLAGEPQPSAVAAQRR